MSQIIDFAAYAEAARERAAFFEEDEEDTGRSMSAGQEASAGQLSANHRSARSRRRTVIETVPRRRAANRRLSPKQRQLTLVKGSDSAVAYARASANKVSVEFIPPKSVIRPVKSRKKLPDTQAGKSDKVPAMNLASILRFIEGRLDELNLSAHKASILAGKPDAIRNMRRSVEKGHGGAHSSTLAALERALNVAPGTLLRIGDDTPAAPAQFTGNEIEQLRAELHALMEQRRLIDQKIEGIQYALTILEGRGNSHRKTR